MIDFLKRLFRRYKYPIITIVVTAMVYDLLGGVKINGGSRAPVPPMTSAENALFVISYIIAIFCAIWIILIAMNDDDEY